MATQVNVREIILETLLLITRDGEYSHIALKNVLDKYQYLEKRERAFITRVVEGQAESAHGSCSRRVSSGIKDAGRIYYHCTTSEYRKRYLSGNRGESVTFKKSL